VRRQGDGLHGNGAHEQPIFGRPSGIDAREELLTSRHIDLMIKVIMRYFTLGPCHRGRDRGAHRLQVETDGALSLLAWRRDDRLPALDVGADDRTAGTAAGDGAKIDTAGRGEPPRCRRGLRASAAWLDRCDRAALAAAPRSARQPRQRPQF
jgi:hypothetical protein